MVVVDFSSLEFLGSGGIGNLLHLQKHLAEKGIGFRLAGLADDQTEVLRITRVTTMIEMFPDVESAVGAGV
jgi:anti-anti-sigma factor